MTAINQACVSRPCRALGQNTDVFAAEQVLATRLSVVFYTLANDLFTESFTRASYARADGDPAVRAAILVI